MMETNWFSYISNSLLKPRGIYPLITFRVIFGLLMLFSTIRFWSNGWIEKFYLEPTHFFSYFGIDWILPYSSEFIYSLFIIMILSCLGIALGLFYRASSLLFFLSFTYVELIDKTTYLNHYYFISLVAFLLIFIPANRAFSIDSKLFPRIKSFKTPAWSIYALQFQIAIVYFYAGLAKLNYDWLIEAQPMSIWLSSKTDLPFIGELFSLDVTAHLFSWIGAVFDLSIAFLLINKRTRQFGYLLVVVFHLITLLLFPIGIFPLVMIGFTLIFFSNKWHKSIYNLLINKELKDSLLSSNRVCKRDSALSFSRVVLIIMGAHFVVQLLVPFRYALIDSNLYWKEDGYRFSWRVMLMEKTGFLEFVIKDSESNKESLVSPAKYFTAFQQRQMVTQPDMILQAAKIIQQDYASKRQNVEVYSNSFCSLNGRKHQRFVNPDVNLALIKPSNNRDWILDYEN